MKKMRLVVLASCAATAAALRWPMPSPMRPPASRAQRAGPLFNTVGQWTANVDQTSGQTFYLNEQTGASQWEAPAGMAGESQSQPAPPGMATTLPAGWTTGVDQASGQTFYLNEQTGASQWEAPAGMAGESQSQAAPPGMATTLPAGWTTGVDQASGQTFYLNEQTGASQWEAPPQAEGGLDFDNYRQFVADSGESLPEEELTRRFNELDKVAQTETAWPRPKATAQSYNGAYSYGPQRAARLEEDRERRGDRYRNPTALQEFLRWQEWYISYCRVRGIGQ